MNSRPGPSPDSATPVRPQPRPALRSNAGAVANAWQQRQLVAFPPVRTAAGAADLATPAAREQRSHDQLALVAHEMRNPLSAISNVAGILSGYSQSEVLRSLGQNLARQAGHLGRLIDDILDFSNVERGALAIATEVIDMRDVARAAVEQVAGPIRARRHELAVLACAEPALVAGDHGRLVQVVANLLHNAAKYTPEGGAITLRIRSRPGFVDVSVTDNGVGMHPDFLQQSFEPFRQAEGIASGRGGGLGLGLSLVRGVIELHAGTIVAASPGLGHGSTLTATLPRAQSPPKQQGPP